MDGDILLELITLNHYQIHMIMRSLVGSKVKASQSWPQNLVNLIAP